jgi:hypothetical protein
VRELEVDDAGEAGEGRGIVEVEPALSQGFGGEGRPISPPPPLVVPGMRCGSTPDELGGSIHGE